MITFIKKNKKRLMKKRGHTLVELSVVLFILGVIAATAIPVYTNSVEQARSNEAIANLNLIHTGERAFNLNNRRYWPNPNGTDAVIANINAGLNVDLSSRFYTLSVTSRDGGYTATATRNNVSRGGSPVLTFEIGIARPGGRLDGVIYDTNGNPIN